MNVVPNEVYSFKLIFGDEMIAKVVAVNGDTLQISSPLSVAPNHGGMGLVPSMFTADMDKNIEINISSIVMYAETAEPIRIKYIEATTGIATTSRKIVLG